MKGSRVHVVTRHPRTEVAPFELQGDPEAPYWRPTCREDCKDVPRPCPYVGCRHNLYLDVTFVGSIVRNWPDRDPDEMPPNCSCVLDVVEDGELRTLEEVGDLLNMTREGARLLERAVMRRLVRKTGELAGCS